MDDERRTRILRRDEDRRRLRRLTVTAGLVGAGLFGAASIAAASSQPGHVIETNPATTGGTVQAPSFSSQPSLQPPAAPPMRGRRVRAVAVSGGS